MFSISISVKGGLRYATPKGIYVSFDSSDSSLKVNSVHHFGTGTIFLLLPSTKQGMGYPNTC